MREHKKCEYNDRHFLPNKVTWKISDLCLSKNVMSQNNSIFFCLSSIKNKKNKMLQLNKTQFLSNFRIKSMPVSRTEVTTIQKCSHWKLDSANFYWFYHHLPSVEELSAMQSKITMQIQFLSIFYKLISAFRYDPEFRKTLVKNVPSIEPVLQMFIDDTNPFADVQKKIDHFTSSITGLFGGSSEKPKEEPKPAKSMWID